MIPGVPSPAEQAKRDGLPRGALERLIAAGVLVVDEGRQVARVETLLAALPRDVRVSHVVADRFHEADLRDASRWPVESRINQWSTASADIAAFRAAVLDGNFAVAEHCQAARGAVLRRMLASSGTPPATRSCARRTGASATMWRRPACFWRGGDGSHASPAAARLPRDDLSPYDFAGLFAFANTLTVWADITKR